MIVHECLSSTFCLPCRFIDFSKINKIYGAENIAKTDVQTKQPTEDDKAGGDNDMSETKRSSEDVQAGGNNDDSSKPDTVQLSQTKPPAGDDKVGGNNNDIAKTDTVQPSQSKRPIEEDKATVDSNGQPLSKRAKKRLQRGQNKKRPPNEKRLPTSLRLCHKLVNGQTCQFGDKCTFSHDVAKMMQQKPADIGKVCHNFETLGKCERGLMCRFGSSHITADFKNVVDEEKWNRVKEASMPKNILPKPVQTKLWKRKMKFEKAQKFLSTDLVQLMKARKERHELSQRKGSNQQSSSDDNGGNQVDQQEGVKPDGVAMQPDEAAPQVTPAPDASTEDDRTQNVSDTCETSNTQQSVTAPAQTSIEKSSSEVGVSNGCQVNAVAPTIQEESSTNNSGVLTDEDVIRLRGCEKKQIDFRDKLYLAPLTTVCT